MTDDIKLLPPIDDSLWETSRLLECHVTKTCSCGRYCNLPPGFICNRLPTDERAMEIFARIKESYRTSKERNAGLDYPLRTRPAVMEWEGHERESKDD